MEGNKDEALKCYNLAEKFLTNGHKEKALKFVHKSIKLYPTAKAEELLKRLGNEECDGNNLSGKHKQHRRASSGHAEKSGSDTDEPEQVNYTQDQVEAVLRIKNCKDYYEVLGLNKSCNDSELKKSYRKLALQFHPDKNKAPGASEAFKRIGNAYGVLSDSEKRRRYDQYGENLGPSRSHRHRNSYEDEFEGDISPEDLFNMFFGGGFPNGRVHVRRGGRNRTFYNVHEHQRNETVSSMYPLVQILPVLLIVLFSLLSSFLIPEPIYSFQRTSQYRYPFTTEKYSVQYFVKDRDIKNKHTEEQIRTIEQKIEREFIETLQVRCYREKQYIAELHHQARLWGSRELLEKANNYNKESCNRLENLHAAGT